jgi:hypothetical protein
MQLELFDNPQRQRTKSTQVDAWTRIRDSCPTARGRVYAMIAAAGERGATRQELANMHNVPINSVCGRVNELLGGKPDRDGRRPYPVLVYEKETRNGQKVLRVR